MAPNDLMLDNAVAHPAHTWVQRSVPWVEPLRAYRLLRASGSSPWLFGGAGEHPHARHVVIALNPLAEVHIDADGIRGTGDADQRARLGATPVETLRSLVQSVRVTNAPPGFAGGLCGYLGYEFAHHFEPVAGEGKPRTLPDAVLRVCPDAVAFDRGRRTVTVTATDALGAGHLSGAAVARAGRVVRVLGQPDPARSAVAAPRVGSAAGVPSTGGTGGPRDLEWATSLDAASFVAAVRRLKEHVREGDLFQANVATRFSAPCAADPADLFQALLAANPSPHMALLEFGDFAIVSGSPELLLSIRAGKVASRPIAGTRARGASAAQDEARERELLADPKERAEHTMLVDLVRNDVARVARPGTVEVTEWMSVERYRHVLHLASQVEADLRPGADLVDALAALFPGGTITGAPKLRAMQRIAQAEPVARGPYTGSAGWLGCGGDASWNILIRTIVVADGQATVHAGSGIVADSVAEREWEEANHKARALLEAATGVDRGSGNRTRLGAVVRHGHWSPPRADPTAAAGRRVLLIDNFDSFVHNLADYCAALGAEVEVVRNDADWRAAVETFRPTHVIISPGPGRPEDAGCSIELIRALSGRVPILGVCLGHQAMTVAFGGRVVVAQQAVHGKTSPVLHDGDGPLAGLPSPLQAARYHSLVADPAAFPPERLRATARLADGMVMALAHRDHPTWGLQFHPESMATEHGLAMVRQFLQAEPPLATASAASFGKRL